MMRAHVLKLLTQRHSLVTAEMLLWAQSRYYHPRGRNGRSNLLSCVARVHLKTAEAFLKSPEKHLAGSEPCRPQSTPMEFR